MIRFKNRKYLIINENIHTNEGREKPRLSSNPVFLAASIILIPSFLFHQVPSVTF